MYNTWHEILSTTPATKRLLKVYCRDIYNCFWVGVQISRLSRNPTGLSTDKLGLTVSVSFFSFRLRPRVTAPDMGRSVTFTRFIITLGGKKIKKSVQLNTQTHWHCAVRSSIWRLSWSHGICSAPSPPFDNIYSYGDCLEVKRKYYLNCFILATCYLFNGHS